jgi:hypothetical protein
MMCVCVGGHTGSFVLCVTKAVDGHTGSFVLCVTRACGQVIQVIYFVLTETNRTIDGFRSGSHES